ncbi:MAG: hypothetical protein HQ546_01955 [Planctomycetes bacterium]|nr:hypothetical protein [Planctomycetota bacterium]
MRRHHFLLLVLSAVAASLPGCVQPGEYGSASGNADAEFSILLRVFYESDHAQLARAWKDSLEKRLGWKDLMVITGSDRSELYRGRLKNSRQARATLKRSQAHRDASGKKPFIRAYITSLPGADPGPPEWNLRNCPGKYSLLVADFQDTPAADPPYLGRRKYAVAYCRQLREQSEQAYYYHDQYTSSVTIGSFGSDAIRFVVEQVPQPKTSGKPELVRKPVPVDPQLLALQKKYPERAWNGRTFYVVVRNANDQVVSRELAKSFLIEVPVKSNE